jgi:methionyl-tRNA formyltransferase
MSGGPASDRPASALAGRVRTIFLGSGRFGVEPLRRVEAHPDVALVAVVTAPPRPAGRRGAVTSTPVHAAATELGVPTILTPERLRSPDSLAAVLDLRPDLAVLVDYGQLVPRPLLDLPHGALNLHPSLLPRHRGASPIPATILAGDRETGVSLMRMDLGLDTGPIVAVARVGLRGDETSPVLEAWLADVGADLLEASLGEWLRGALPTTAQGEDGATLTRPLRREDGRLDAARPAAELERQIRAYQPWPGSWVETPAGRLTAWRATVEAATGESPGTLGPRGLATADGLLAFAEVQPAGGRRMSWEAFLRGRPEIAGPRT